MQKQAKSHDYADKGALLGQPQERTEDYDSLNTEYAQVVIFSFGNYNTFSDG